MWPVSPGAVRRPRTARGRSCPGERQPQGRHVGASRHPRSCKQENPVACCTTRRQRFYNALIGDQIACAFFPCAFAYASCCSLLSFYCLHVGPPNNGQGPGKACGNGLEGEADCSPVLELLLQQPRVRRENSGERESACDETKRTSRKGRYKLGRHQEKRHPPPAKTGPRHRRGVSALQVQATPR